MNICAVSLVMCVGLNMKIVYNVNEFFFEDEHNNENTLKLLQYENMKTCKKNQNEQTNLQFHVHMIAHHDRFYNL